MISIMMKVLRMFILFTLIPIQCIECSKESDKEDRKECLIKVDTIDFSFEIDYANPDKYLIPGTQSELNDSYLEEIRNSIGDPGNTIEDVLNVCHWVNQHFIFENAGGAMIGENTVNELFELRTFYGCHSQALIISSILREFGFPAIMIETVDVEWGYDYHAGSVQHFSGHVMSEVFVENAWTLLDNNCTYVKEYDPLNPYIPMLNYPTYAYFVFAKGTDIWDYTKNDDTFTHESLIFFSENIYCFEELFNTVEYIWSN